MNYISHRGVHQFFKENTLQAFEQAMENGFNYIEFDIRRLADGNLVILHNSKIKGIPLRSIDISTLRAIDPDVPLFEEVLSNIGLKVKLDIELKEEGYENEVMTLVHKYINESQYMISSFHPRSLIKIQKQFPLTKVGLLISRGTCLNLLYLRNFKLVLPKLVLVKLMPWIFRQQSKEVIVWDITKAKDFQKLITWSNISGIISDNERPLLQ